MRDLKSFLKGQKEVLDALLPAFGKARVYFVGGALRDFLWGIRSKDFDMEVFGLKDFEGAMSKIGAKPLGMGVYERAFGAGIYNFSLARKEQKSGFGHKAYEISYCDDEKQASLRRDFTINALMLNAKNALLLDFHGALSDIENKLLRVLNPDFADDDLRLLRALDFISRFKLKIDESSFKILLGMSLNELNRAVLKDYLLKFLRNKNPELALFYAHKFSVLNDILGLDISRNNLYKLLWEFKERILVVNSDAKDLFFFLLSAFTEGKSYKNQVFLENPSAYELCEIARKMPIKSWLGLDKKSKALATRLAIYENSLKFDLNINKALSKDELKADIKNQEYIFIKNYLKRKNMHE